jgi:hypothetical protein
MTTRPPKDVLAFDLATQAGWARGVPGAEPLCGTIRFASEGASHGAIAAGAITWLADYLAIGPKPDVIVYEATLPSAFKIGATTANTTRILNGLCFLLEGVAHLRGVYDIRFARVDDVRRHFIEGIPCARGEQKMIVQRKCRSLGWAPQDDNAADALALWSYQCSLLDAKSGLRVSPLFANRRASL